MSENPTNSEPLVGNNPGAKNALFVVLFFGVVFALYYFSSVSKRRVEKNSAKLIEIQTRYDSLTRIVNKIDAEKSTSWFLKVPWQYIKGSDSTRLDTLIKCQVYIKFEMDCCKNPKSNLMNQNEDQLNHKQ